MPKLVVVGWVSLDILKILGTWYKSPGGAALYSCIASVHHTSTGLVARIGSDYPETLILKLQSLGVDMSGIKRVPGLSTRFEVSYDAEWHVHFERVELGVGSYLDCNDFPDNYKGAEYMLIAPMHPAIQERWISLGSDLGMHIALGTSHIYTRVPELKNRVLSIMGNAEIFICNLHEASHLFGTRAPYEAACVIGKKVMIGIVTLDKEGAMIAYNDRVNHHPAIPTTVIDPSGAGDVFAGSFVGHWIEHQDIEQAVEVALQAASRIVSAPGVAAILPDAVEIVNVPEDVGHGNILTARSTGV
jgi:sugar/nucleoside kinase (ribokinase family)